LDSEKRRRLRREAEQKLEKEIASTELSADARKLVEELQVHQIELEMQNDELRKSREELASLQEHYYDLFEKAPVGYVVLDDRGMIQEANLTAAELLGIERSRMKGRPFFRFVDTQDQSRYSTYFDRILASNGTETGNLLLKKKTADILYAATEGIAVNNGGKQGVRLTISDVSARVKAQRSHEESESKFRFLYDHAPAIFLVVDADGVVQDVNQQTLDQLGYGREEVIGRTAEEFVAFQHTEYVSRALQHAFAGEGTKPREIIVHGRDRTPHIILFAAGNELVRKDGRVQGVLFTGLDVTRQRRAEKEAAERDERSRRQLEDLVESSRTVLAAKSMDDLLSAIAQKVRALTGARIASAGYGHADGSFRNGAVSRADGAPDCMPGTAFTIEHTNVFQDILDSGTILRLTDEEMRAHPRWWGLPEGHAPLRGLLGLPLVDRTGRVNGLIMASDKEGGWTLLLKMRPSLPS